MKSGCFLKTIIVLTVIVAAIMYIIQHKSEWFIKPGKKMIAGIFMDDWDNHFNYVKNTPEKDELKNSLKTFIEKLKYKKLPDDKEIDNIIDMVNSAASDSIISISELRNISKKLELLNNERPE